METEEIDYGDISVYRPKAYDNTIGIANVVAKGFLDDPVWTAGEPNIHKRALLLGALFRSFTPDPKSTKVVLRGAYNKNLDGVYSKAVSGALWERSDVELLYHIRSFIKLIFAMIFSLGIIYTMCMLPRVIRVFLNMASKESEIMKNKTHLHLVGVATLKEFRGKKIGTRLLKPELDYADKCNLPCYLESTNPRNVSLYLRLGFSIMGETVAFGKQVILMYRPSAS
jgi:GNAT superfamily N-acetyltransferase